MAAAAPPTNHTAAPGPWPAMRQALRLHLQVLTDRLPCHLHAASVQRLAAAHASAHVRALSEAGAPPQPLYNCVMHALDLVGRFEPPLQRLQGLEYRYVVDTAFLRQALALGVIDGERSLAEAMPGDLVVYFGRSDHPRARLPRHVGKYLGRHKGMDLCVSKWGPGGLYEHGLWDLPLQLGDSARFFPPPQPHRVLALLHRREPGLRMGPARADSAASSPKRRAPPYTAVFAGHAELAPAHRRDPATTA